MKNYISYILILIGGGISIYAKMDNLVLLVIGIICLMVGVGILDANLSSKPAQKDYEIKEEEE